MENNNSKCCLSIDNVMTIGTMFIVSIPNINNFFKFY